MKLRNAETNPNGHVDELKQDHEDVENAGIATENCMKN